MPIRAIANQDTWLKKTTDPADSLTPDKKVFKNKESEIVIAAYNPVKPEDKGHRKITLDYGQGTWYIFSEHWLGLPDNPNSSAQPSYPAPSGWATNQFGLAVPPADLKDFKLPVPYFSQLDNSDRYQGPGNRQCRTSSNAMMIEYATHGSVSSDGARKGFKSADDYWGYLVYQAGYDTTKPTGHVIAAERFKVTAPFVTTGSLADLRKSLRLGYPVALGVAYKASGHYIVAVGLRGDDFWVHDPYGVRQGTSDQYTADLNGAYDLYTQSAIQQIWVDLGPEKGYTHYIKEINGQPTGVVF